MKNSLGVSLGAAWVFLGELGCKSLNSLGGVGCVPIGTPKHPNYDRPLQVLNYENLFR